MRPFLIKYCPLKLITKYYCSCSKCFQLSPDTPVSIFLFSTTLQFSMTFRQPGFISVNLWNEEKKMKLEHESYCARPSPSALIKHTESDKVLSQVCVHVRVRKSPPCPLDVTGKEDFTGCGEVKSWKQQELRRRL